MTYIVQIGTNKKYFHVQSIEIYSVLAHLFYKTKKGRY